MDSGGCGVDGVDGVLDMHGVCGDDGDDVGYGLGERMRMRWGCLSALFWGDF